MSSRRVPQVLQKALGVGYLAGSTANLVFTLPERDEVFDSFAEMAWLPPYEWLIEEVVGPAGLPFMIGLVGFEAAVGSALIAGDENLARQANRVAVAFNIALIPSLAFPYLLGNVALIAVHATLAQRPVADSERTVIEGGR